MHYGDVLSSCDEALHDLGTDYLDLFLIHWPNKKIPMPETLQAIDELHEQGKVRSIGVSNFTISHIDQAVAVSGLPIANNQVEFHPSFYQKELLEFCQSRAIALTAYCPLGRGADLNNKVIVVLADKYAKTPAQICLRWLVQKGAVVIPKSASPAHLHSNMDIFDWQLASEDEQKIDNISQQQRLIDPDFGEF